MGARHAKSHNPLLALSAVFEPGNWQALREASWIGWGGAAYSALFASLLGHGLYYVLVQRHPVAQVTPWLLIAPMLAVVLGIVFWGDRPGPRLWIGGAMVLGGVLFIALRAMSKSRTLPAALRSSSAPRPAPRALGGAPTRPPGRWCSARPEKPWRSATPSSRQPRTPTA